MSDDSHKKDEAEARREEKMRGYRKDYWERFKETRKRIYGTLTVEEYEEIEMRAKEAGRSVWAQLHGEAEAYAKQEYLPPKKIEKQYAEVITQLRRIGTNINQIARDQKGGNAVDHRGFYYSLKQFEAMVEAFAKNPARNDDDEPPTS